MGDRLTIHQMVETHAELAPNHIAIISDNVSYNYKTLNHKANQLAHFLLSFHLKSDSLIAIALDHSPQLIIGILAILKAGCGYLPLDTKHPNDRLEFILEDTKAPVLITQAKSKHKFSNFTGRIILIDQIWNELKLQPISNPSRVVEPDNLAYAIYTSGSTGKPKGVLIEHRSVVNYIRWFSEYSGCQAQDRIDFSSSIIFDMAVTTTITALSLGLQISICSDELKKNITQYLSYLNKMKITIIKLTPSYFKRLVLEAKTHHLALPDLKSILVGGEILYSKDCQAWLELYPTHHLYNEYGPTETTVAVSQYQVTQHNAAKLGHIVPIGKAGLNIHCLVLNENNQLAAPGEIGELHIGGSCLARGYLNQPALTAKKFINDTIDVNAKTKWYKTGDLCRYLQDGNIEVIKRIDDQVKIRGYRIEPQEIEASLMSHPLVKEAVLVVRKNPLGEAQLIAYYIPECGNTIPSNHDLRSYLQKKIPDYMLPSSLIMMREFPLTENGKLDKKALQELVFSHEIVKPQTKIEHQLMDVWRREFHLQDIGIKSNFFELGGHSLIAVRILSEIEKHFGKKIKLETLYQAPTIAQLASIIKNAPRTRRERRPKTRSTHDLHRIPLGDFQFTFWISNLFEPKIKQLNIVDRRRIAGKLDIHALTLALEWIFKKHEILICHVGKYLPVLYLNKNIKYRISEKDLTNCSDDETEKLLANSLNELINKPLWQKNTPLIAVKLFYLNNEITELQISVSHMGFDDASEEVLFADLSTAYLHIKNGMELPAVIKHPQYKDYILHEKNNLNQNLERDIQFWQTYLQDTALVVMPEKEVVSNMENIPYSTYLDLPADIIEHTHEICTAASVSITNVLCAAVTLALKNTVDETNDNIFINIVRSVRDNEVFDNMVGCFLRLDPIKVQSKTNLGLIELAQVIQQSRIETEAYQACSGMVKLACLDKTYRKKKVSNFIMNLLTKLYCKLFSRLNLNAKMLIMYGRLNSLRTKKQFLINMNLFNNFISPAQDSTLFGYKFEKIKNHEYDLSKIDNVLDICIFRNNSLNKNHLVISGNLQPSFRQMLGEKIIEMIKNK